VVFKLFYTGRFKRLSTLIYIAMGWLVRGRDQADAGARSTAGPSAGCSPAACSTRWARSSTTANRSATRTRSGTCSCIAGSVCHYVAVMARARGAGTLNGAWGSLAASGDVALQVVQFLRWSSITAAPGRRSRSPQHLRRPRPPAGGGCDGSVTTCMQCSARSPVRPP
jgi:hypothetical protein